MKLKFNKLSIKNLFLLFLFALQFLFFSGCATSIADLDYKPKLCKQPKTTNEKDIEVTYLGASGLLIKRGNFAILTAPFFSNPSLLKAVFLPISPDTQRIDAGLNGVSLADVKAIFVGHSHYDHLMDVPHVYGKIINENPRDFLPPRIYGSDTMKNILLRLEGNGQFPINPADIVSINGKAANGNVLGEWVCFNDQGETDCKDSGIVFRFMPIISMHAPHFVGIKIFGGHVESPEGKAPKCGWGWKEGQTFTYLMDFLGSNGEIDFRIHFQDAGAEPGIGVPPDYKPADNQKDPVDLSIVCVAAFDQVEQYPESVIKSLNPRNVILTHWENFFEPFPVNNEEFRVVPGTYSDELIKERLIPEFPAGSNCIFPMPGSRIVLKTKEEVNRPHRCSLIINQ